MDEKKKVDHVVNFDEGPGENIADAAAAEGPGRSKQE